MDATKVYIGTDVDHEAAMSVAEFAHAHGWGKPVHSEPTDPAGIQAVANAEASDWTPDDEIVPTGWPRFRDGRFVSPPPDSMITEPSTKTDGYAAMAALSASMKTDHAYAWSWHCNIAMASIDEGVEHGAANRAAAQFMRNAFGVDTSKFREFPTNA